MNKTTRREHALKNNISGNVTIFTDHGVDEMIVTLVDRRLVNVLSTKRMPRSEARDEWSTMRAYSTVVDASKL